MTGSASATSSKICRDRHTVGKTRIPEDELRDSLTGGARPNSIADSPWPNAPAGRHLVARAQLTNPSQIQKPAEGPSFRPSLALNIDPAPVHALTHITLPQHPARAPIQSCSSYSPLQLTRITPSSSPHQHDSTTTPAPDLAPDPYLHLIQSNQHSAVPPVRVSSPLYLFQSSHPLSCIIHRHWDQLQVRSRTSPAPPQVKGTFPCHSSSPGTPHL